MSTVEYSSCCSSYCRILQFTQFQNFLCLLPLTLKLTVQFLLLIACLLPSLQKINSSPKLYNLFSLPCGIIITVSISMTERIRASLEMAHYQNGTTVNIKNFSVNRL